MFTINNYDIKITVNLDNGVYIFDNQSAAGKTRLCKLLKKYKVSGEPVASYTYDDKVLGLPLETVFSPENKLIMLDRYDMYKGDADNLIKKYCNKAIILIDLKNEYAISEMDDWCIIEMTTDSINIFNDR